MMNQYYIQYMWSGAPQIAIVEGATMSAALLNFFNLYPNLTGDSVVSCFLKGDPRK